MTEISAFANRLRKNVRHLSRWARRANISCYRLYDCDVPEFPVTVDWYQGDAGARVHLQEVDTGWQQTDEEHQAFVDQVAADVSSVLEIAVAAVIFKRRFRQRVGKALDLQYQASGVTGQDFVISEGPCRFIVNLEAYLDTGLFLDHRITRQMVRDRARGKRVLNLFAYTASFSVHAAQGGAVSTLSVDLSNSYCDWARRNFDLNQLDPRHRIVRADVLVWLIEEIRRETRYDLIVLDPPSFSNSKKMNDVFDVQRDHGRLIRQCMALLAPAGELFFSTNLRSFSLEPGLDGAYQVDDITQRTIPEDFRDQRIHRAYLLRAR